MTGHLLGAAGAIEAIICVLSIVNDIVPPTINHQDDDMDENILYNMLHVEANSEEAQKIESILRRCGETAVTLIRREQIDPQTPMAFHVFARTCRTMFRIGAAIQLNRLGYKFEKVYLN